MYSYTWGGASESRLERGATAKSELGKVEALNSKQALPLPLKLSSHAGVPGRVAFLCLSTDIKSHELEFLLSKFSLVLTIPKNSPMNASKAELLM